MGERVSVLMGIYNCADTLEQAVLSIQNQTHSDWELILCDDGSADDTYRIAKMLAERDSRIILLKNERNMGLNHTLNRCLRTATGDYIARMDGDDECLPERFEKQLEVLRNHPQIDIVSSHMALFDETGEWGLAKIPVNPGAEQIVGGTAIHHAAVLMRKSAIDAVGGYSEDPGTMRVEDLDLWIRLYARGSRCYNIQEPLYRMRNDQNALMRRKYRYRINSARVRLRGCRELKLGPVSYVRAIRPLIIGLIPAQLRHYLRKFQRGVSVK